MRTETLLRAYAKIIAGLAVDRTKPRRMYQRQAVERELMRRAMAYDRMRVVKSREDHLADARKRMRWIFGSWWTHPTEAAEAAGFSWRACIMRGYAELWRHQ